MRRATERLIALLLASTLLAGCTSASKTILPSGLPATSSQSRDAASGACVFKSASKPVSVAFCETFEHPAGIGKRSGDLNGTLWGVSRQLGATNFGQGQYNAVAGAIMQRCGRNVHVTPPNDVAVCDGRLVEAVNDNGSVTSLAMYPKQPFDIAGRTGTIVFDVSDDSQGAHRVWPELWYTDQPVPDPFVHFSSLQSVPVNGFGVRFAAFCPPNVPGCGVRFICPDEPANVGVVTVDSAVVVNNYVSDDSFTDVKPGPISVKAVGCVKASSGPGDMNHFELRVSQNRIVVFGTDAGKTAPLRKIAIISNMKLTLTRGLVWLEDAHYNANKEGFGPDQGTHTFTWDNVGFDGPVLPRDLAFDVLDRLEPVGPLLNLGWAISPTDAKAALAERARRLQRCERVGRAAHVQPLDLQQSRRHLSLKPRKVAYAAVAVRRLLHAKRLRAVRRENDRGPRESRRRQDRHQHRRVQNDRRGRNLQCGLSIARRGRAKPVIGRVFP